MLLPILLIFGFLSSVLSEESCYATNREPYRRVGQKSSYFINENLDDTEILEQGCQPRMLWYLSRHGARKPSAGEISDWILRVPELQARILTAMNLGEGEMCEEDFLNIGEWVLDKTEDDHKILYESGKEEHRRLGARWSHRLPSLLHDPELAQTRATYKQRTYASAEAFLEGAFTGENTTFPHIMVTDIMLRFHDFCPAYFCGVDQSDRTFVEEHKFMEGPYYTAMVEDVSRRVGVQLNTEDVELAWALCRYDLAEFPDVWAHVSPWCAVFSEENLKILEFTDDLSFYYKDGYGYDINWQMTKPLVEELQLRFQELSDGTNERQAYLYFGHSETVNPFHVVFGLYNSSHPLVASDWPELAVSHPWQTSKMLGFSHNLALVAMECPDREEKLQVAFFHQERPIVVPACADSLCPFSKFMEILQPVLDVDFEYECNHDSIFDPDGSQQKWFEC